MGAVFEDPSPWPVPAALRPFLDHWEPFFLRLDPRAVHHGVPSPTATMIIAFDEPLDVGWVANPAQHERHWIMVGGLHTGPALVRTHGVQHGIQLALTPLGVRRLLGVPVAALTNEIVGGERLPIGLDDRTHDRLQHAASWPERRTMLTSWLHGVLGRDDREIAVPTDVRRAWSLLAHHHGSISVAQLADDVGWSRRHLVTRFHGELGVTPKQAARLFRFDRARSLAQQGVELSAVAARCGYADQAHLTRDWVDLAGRPPATTIAEPFSILQD